MVIKINYNVMAAICGVVIVLCFSIAELMLPLKPVNAEAEALELRLPVIMYHHISKTPSRLGDYVISPEQLEEDLQYLQRCGYKTVGAGEILAFIKLGVELPKKSVMITFDDGYESVHEYAFPLLQKYGMKAVISIIGKHTDIFSQEGVQKGINYSHCSWEQLREMQESGVFEVQNHSYDMHENNGGRKGIKILSNETLEEYERKLNEDVGGLSDKIEKELGTRPILFAYPFGAISKESRTLLSDMGFFIILTCEEKVNHIEQFSELPISLRRFNRAHRYGTESYMHKLGIEE